MAGGPYAIIPSAAAGGTFSADNYTITYANGALTINPAPLTVSASDAVKTYGQTPTLTAFTSSGLQNNETIGAVTETSAGSAPEVAGGPWAIVPSNASGGSFNAANYTIAYVDGMLTMNVSSGYQNAVGAADSTLQTPLSQIGAPTNPGPNSANPIIGGIAGLNFTVVAPGVNLPLGVH